MKITLSMAISSNPRTWPILDGTVKPDGIDLVPTVLHPSEMFWRQARDRRETPVGPPQPPEGLRASQ